jgi:hypothetical protein
LGGGAAATLAEPIVSAFYRSVHDEWHLSKEQGQPQRPVSNDYDLVKQANNAPPMTFPTLNPIIARTVTHGSEPPAVEPQYGGSDQLLRTLAGMKSENVSSLCNPSKIGQPTEPSQEPPSKNPQHGINHTQYTKHHLVETATVVAPASALLSVRPATVHLPLCSIAEESLPTSTRKWNRRRNKPVVLFSSETGTRGPSFPTQDAAAAFLRRPASAISKARLSGHSVDGWTVCRDENSNPSDKAAIGSMLSMAEPNGSVTTTSPTAIATAKPAAGFQLSRRALHSAQMKTCAAIWKELNTLDTGAIFMQPVDVSVAIDYPMYIDKQMDLGTIRAKVDSLVYDDHLDFAADVRLMLTNCHTYSATWSGGAAFSEHATAMECLFEASYKKKFGNLDDMVPPEVVATPVKVENMTMHDNEVMMTKFRYDIFQPSTSGGDVCQAFELSLQQSIVSQCRGGVQQAETEWKDVWAADSGDDVNSCDSADSNIHIDENVADENEEVMMVAVKIEDTLAESTKTATTSISCDCPTDVTAAVPIERTPRQKQMWMAMLAALRTRRNRANWKRSMSRARKILSSTDMKEIGRLRAQHNYLYQRNQSKLARSMITTAVSSCDKESVDKVKNTTIASPSRGGAFTVLLPPHQEPMAANTKKQAVARRSAVKRSKLKCASYKESINGFQPAIPATTATAHRQLSSVQGFKFNPAVSTKYVPNGKKNRSSAGKGVLPRTVSGASPPDCVPTKVTEYGKSFFLCSMIGCKYKGSRMADFKKHCQGVHYETRNFFCRRSSCNKAFKDSTTRCRHERTHDSIKYRCEGCSNFYTRPDNLRAHFTEKHPEKAALIRSHGRSKKKDKKDKVKATTKRAPSNESCRASKKMRHLL